MTAPHSSAIAPRVSSHPQEAEHLVQPPQSSSASPSASSLSREPSRDSFTRSFPPPHSHVVLPSRRRPSSKTHSLKAPSTEAPTPFIPSRTSSIQSCSPVLPQPPSPKLLRPIDPTSLLHRPRSTSQTSVSPALSIRVMYDSSSDEETHSQRRQALALARRNKKSSGSARSSPTVPQHSPSLSQRSGSLGHPRHPAASKSFTPGAVGSTREGVPLVATTNFYGGESIKGKEKAVDLFDRRASVASGKQSFRTASERDAMGVSLRDGTSLGWSKDKSNVFPSPPPSARRHSRGFTASTYNSDLGSGISLSSEGHSPRLGHGPVDTVFVQPVAPVTPNQSPPSTPPLVRSSANTISTPSSLPTPPPLPRQRFPKSAASVTFPTRDYAANRMSTFSNISARSKNNSLYFPPPPSQRPESPTLSRVHTMEPISASPALSHYSFESEYSVAGDVGVDGLLRGTISKRKLGAAPWEEEPESADELDLMVRAQSRFQQGDELDRMVLAQRRRFGEAEPVENRRQSGTSFPAVPTRAAQWKSGDRPVSNAWESLRAEGGNVYGDIAQSEEEKGSPLSDADVFSSPHADVFTSPNPRYTTSAFRRASTQSDSPVLDATHRHSVAFSDVSGHSVYEDALSETPTPSPVPESLENGRFVPPATTPTEQNYSKLQTGFWVDTLAAANGGMDDINLRLSMIGEVPEEEEERLLDTGTVASSPRNSKRLSLLSSQPTYISSISTPPTSATSPVSPNFSLPSPSFPPSHSLYAHSNSSSVSNTPTNRTTGKSKLGGRLVPSFFGKKAPSMPTNVGIGSSNFAPQLSLQRREERMRSSEEHSSPSASERSSEGRSDEHEESFDAKYPMERRMRQHSGASTSLSSTRDSPPMPTKEVKVFGSMLETFARQEQERIRAISTRRASAASSGVDRSTPVSNRYLDDRSFKIRSKQVPWEGYQRAGLLSADDVALIQRVAGQKDKADAILDKEGETFASLYVRLLSKLSRNDTLQSILVLIGDMLADHDERIPLFLSQPDTYSALLKLLESPDEFVKLKGAVLISTFLASDSKPETSVISTLLGHLNTLVRNEADAEGQDVGVQCLEGILRVEKVRGMVWSAEGKASDKPKISEALVLLLKSNPVSQMQYQLAFCFWLLTFDVPIAESINSKYQIIPLLVEVAKSAVKEKVIRITMAVFRNLVTKAPSANLSAMLVARLLPFVQSLSNRKWSDEEIQEDIEFLAEELKASFEGLTTYDEYVSELQSGLLTWSPPHKNDDFWRDNASKLNEKDRLQLKTLVQLLISSSNPLVLAVAANDIAQYAKFCDTGKKNLEDLGAKARVMELMSSSQDPDVKYQSLVATQRLISQPWA